MLTWNRILQSAIGYHELGMAEEALRELDTVGPAHRGEIPTLELRAVLLLQLGRWQEAADTHAELCRLDGACAERFIAWGCCLYELGRIADCRAALSAAPAAARGHGLWNFHLACYESLLGHKEEAGRLIHRALELDPRLLGMARRNENLAPLLAPEPA